MHVNKGDLVEVITGRNKGKRGKIIEVLITQQRVRIEGVNIIKRHTKPSQKVPEGGIIEKFGTVHVSNVQLIDPKSDKPTRVGSRLLGDGRKVRIARRSGEELS